MRLLPSLTACALGMSLTVLFLWWYITVVTVVTVVPGSRVDGYSLRVQFVHNKKWPAEGESGAAAQLSTSFKLGVWKGLYLPEKFFAQRMVCPSSFALSGYGEELWVCRVEVPSVWHIGHV